MPKQKRCEEQCKPGCPLLRTMKQAGMNPDDPRTFIPVTGMKGTLLLVELRETFSNFVCHAGNWLGSNNLPPVGFLCLGTVNGEYLRVLLSYDDVVMLLASLEEMRREMQMVMQQPRAAAEQVQ